MLEYFVFVICQPYFLASNLFYIYFYFILQTENILKVKKGLWLLKYSKGTINNGRNVLFASKYTNICLHGSLNSLIHIKIYHNCH